jgi:hypothetical protein
MLTDAIYFVNLFFGIVALGFKGHFQNVIPAQAGTQNDFRFLSKMSSPRKRGPKKVDLDSRLRGNDNQKSSHKCYSI